MILQALAGLGAALMITTAVEAAVGWLLGLRDGRSQFMLLLINIITNPVLNLALLLAASFGFHKAASPLDPLLLAMEAAVILIEAALLMPACRMTAARAAVASLLMNLASWLAGVLLLW